MVVQGHYWRSEPLLDLIQQAQVLARKPRYYFLVPFTFSVHSFSKMVAASDMLMSESTVAEENSYVEEQQEDSGIQSIDALQSQGKGSGRLSDSLNSVHPRHRHG